MILAALAQANEQHAIAYGGDELSGKAEQALKDVFGPTSESFFVFNGTAANILALGSMVQSYHAVLCAETAHIHCDECGAPEGNLGCKLLTASTVDGKLTVDSIAHYLHAVGVQHHSQPKVISISQPTELGTVYTPDEIRTLADFAHSHQMYLHIDGARLSNAAAALGCSLADITVDAGADVLSFGGTKNGLLYGEAVVFFRPALAVDFQYRRKQAMQVASKMRYVAAQFLAYLHQEQWRVSAGHANKMARLLATEVGKIPQVRITQKVDVNGVFAILPAHIIPRLQARYFFYVWNEATHEVRWMTSWDTTEEDIYNFVSAIKELLN